MLQNFWQWLNSITLEHVRAAGIVWSLGFGVSMFLIGMWVRHQWTRAFKKEDLTSLSIVIKLFAPEKVEDGSIYLREITVGGSTKVETFFGNDPLTKRVQRAAKRHPGLMQLRDRKAQRMMMTEAEDKITGLDPQANADFLAGRPTTKDPVIFGYGAYKETDRDGDGMTEQIGRTVLMVIHERHAQDFADPEFIKNLKVEHTGEHDHPNRVHDLAREWVRLESLPKNERSSGIDKVWRAMLRTSTQQAHSSIRKVA